MFRRLALQMCIMNHDPKDRLSIADQRDTAAKDADIAVRRSLVEGRQHILNFLRRRLGDTEAAEDVLQTFMLRAMDRFEQLRDVRAVRGWLGQILASSFADYGRNVARQRQREMVMAPTDLDSVQDGFDEELDEAICNCLYKLLPTLRPEYAEVIWRVDLQEQSREAVARRPRHHLEQPHGPTSSGSAGAQDKIGTDVPDLPGSWLSRLRLRRSGKGPRAVSGA